MNMASQLPASAGTTQADPAGAREESRACSPGMAREDLQALDDLVGLGMKLARVVARVGSGAAAPEEAAAFEGVDLCLAFSRVARAVRQTVALKARLADEGRGRREAAEEMRRELAVDGARRARRKRHVEAAVAQAIEARFEAGERFEPAGAGRETETLLIDLRERLEDPDTGDEIGYREVGKIVEGICRDLGVPVPWHLWRETSWFVREGWEAEEPAAPAAPAERTPAREGRGFATIRRELYGAEHPPIPRWMEEPGASGRDPPAGGPA